MYICDCYVATITSLAYCSCPGLVVIRYVGGRCMGALESKRLYIVITARACLVRIAEVAR